MWADVLNLLPISFGEGKVGRLALSLVRSDNCGRSEKHSLHEAIYFPNRLHVVVHSHTSQLDSF